MPGRSQLGILPFQRSQSDNGMDKPTDKKASRKERKTLRKLKQDQLRGLSTEDVNEIPRTEPESEIKVRSPLSSIIRKDKRNGEDKNGMKERKRLDRLESEEDEDKRKSNSLTRLFGKIKKQKDKDVKDDEEAEYASPTESLMSECSSSGYFTPLPPSSDYETPVSPSMAEDQSDEDSGCRRTDLDPTMIGNTSTSSSLQDILGDTTITDLPESSQVYFFGPSITKIAETDGRLIEPEEIVLKSGENRILDKAYIYKNDTLPRESLGGSLQDESGPRDFESSSGTLTNNGQSESHNEFKEGTIESTVEVSLLPSREDTNNHDRLIEPEEIVLKSGENRILDKAYIYKNDTLPRESLGGNLQDESGPRDFESSSGTLSNNGQSESHNGFKEGTIESTVEASLLPSREDTNSHDRLRSLERPGDADSDDSNTSNRSTSDTIKEVVDSFRDNTKPARPTSIDFVGKALSTQVNGTHKDLGRLESSPTMKGNLLAHVSGTHEQTDALGLPESSPTMEAEALQEQDLSRSAPVSPQASLEAVQSKGSSISSLLESQVSHTDSDTALQEPETERKPLILSGPKPYQREKRKLDLPVAPKDSLPFPISIEAKPEGLSPPPPSPASSTLNLVAKEPVRNTTVAPETSLRQRRDSAGKALPPIPVLGKQSSKERKAMLDSDSLAKPMSPELLGSEKQEHLYKVLVIGELSTGKTSIIKRYVHEFFSQHYRATIGVDFALKVLHWNENTIIRLQLWDIAGQERFNNMTRVYYKEAVGAFIVFDVTRAATFEAVAKWKQDLDSKVQLPDGTPIPCVLLANKCDQQKEGIANYPAKLDEYCREKGFIGWYETSAKDNVNIDEASRFLVTKILENDCWQENEADSTKVTLERQSSKKDKKSSCC